MSNFKVRAFNALPVLAALAVLALFLAINLRMPLFADDYCLALPEFSWRAIAEETWASYWSWNGRFPAIFADHAAFSSGRLGIQILALISTAALATLMVCAVFLTDRPRSVLHRLSVLSVFLYLLWFTPHIFGETVLWKTGSIHYFLAVSCAAACFVPAVRVLVRTESLPMPASALPFYLAMCFAGGAWLENQSVAVAAVWLALLLWARKRNQAIPFWATAGWLAWLAGTTALIVAPGNYARVAAVGKGPALHERLDFILNWIPKLLNGRLFLLFALFVTMSSFNRSEELRGRLAQALAFAATGLLSALALIGVPVNVIHGRPSFPLEVFFVFAVISVFPSEVFGRTGRMANLHRALATVAAAVLASVLLRDMIDTRNTYRKVWRQDLARKAIVQDGLSAGIRDIALPALVYGPNRSTYRHEFSNGRLFSRDISPEKEHWTNSCYAKAHGLNSVVQVR